MGLSKQQKATWPVRGKIYSPGRPPVWQRDQVQQFWIEIANGLSSEDAAITVGVSSPVGSRWFREAGGMRPVTLDPLSGRYLSFAEREEIAILQAKGCGVREIARQINRSPSTISRELRRNAATRSGTSVIGPSMRSGTQIAGPKGRRWPSWLQTRSYVTTCRTGFRG